jgi:4-amino-4-deoxychorismate lyase
MTLVDGSPAATVPVDDRGLAYGDGLFETMRAEAGAVPLLARHLARLRRGCAQLGIEAAADEVWRSDLARLALPTGRCAVKLVITRGSGPRGYRPLTVAAPRRIASWSPLAVDRTRGERGVVLGLSAVRLASGGELAGLKHLNRLEQVLAQRALADADEHLMLDPAGAVICGTMTNLFLARDGALVTPALDGCGVRGVARELVIERAAALGISCAERRVERPELDGADELFVCNALVGIWPVRELAGRRLAPGALTGALQQELAAHGLPP